MEKIEILVLGKDPDILQTVVRLINAKDELSGEGTTEEEEVIEWCQRKDYDMLLLGGGISPEAEKKVRTILSKLRPFLKIIQHYGGGSGLLYNEIHTALSSDEGSKFTIVDNPF